MQRVKIGSAIFITIIAFYFYLLALMKLFPLLLAAPLFYGAILYTISAFSNRKRFKGFK